MAVVLDLHKQVGANLSLRDWTCHGFTVDAGDMTENGWQAIGRIAKARRERLGLKQDELVLYGGPGVSTVGKFERAAQTSFPLRTQHQIERALGWSRTIIEQVVRSVDEGELSIADWEHDLVEEDIPDMSHPQSVDPDGMVEHLDAIASVLRLIEEERRSAAVRAALLAMLPLLSDDGATELGQGLRLAHSKEGGDGHVDEAAPIVRELTKNEVDLAAYGGEADEPSKD